MKKPKPPVQLYTARCSVCDERYGPCTLTALTAEHGVHARQRHKLKPKALNSIPVRDVRPCQPVGAEK